MFNEGEKKVSKAGPTLPFQQRLRVQFSLQNVMKRHNLATLMSFMTAVW